MRILLGLMMVVECLSFGIRLRAVGSGLWSGFRHQSQALRMVGGTSSGKRKAVVTVAAPGAGGELKGPGKWKNERKKSENPNPDRPFTLPPGKFRPKQSLGQNFLSDQNYVVKICDALSEDSEKGCRVVEVGPGPGALSRVLVQRYPSMTAIELDQRAVAFLGEKLPGLEVIRQDVLEVDWQSLANTKGGPVSVIANLPYYIVSQVLFSFADAQPHIRQAVVTMQLEVADRITAKPSTKAYGIPSVVFQLYAQPKLNFKIPPSVFFPKPNVDSALVTLDFTKPHPQLHRVHGDHLRKVVTTAFRQRRKMMRASLREMIEAEGLTLPERWSTLRPEQLQPEDFLQLTADLFGEIPGWSTAAVETNKAAVWRKALFPAGAPELKQDESEISDLE